MRRMYLQSQYRPDIDGIRAMAILSVVIYHAFPSLLPGGYTGVDIFFVISGYLITLILVQHLEAGTFSFVDFYSRRILRIFPGLLLILIASLIAAWILLLSNEFTQLSKHVASSTAFISNFIFWGESGYFDTIVAKKPLLHLWSLGIEEQFYLFWPILLLLIWKIRRYRLAILTGLLLSSFLLNLHELKANGNADFYSPLTRWWELMIGALLAARIQLKPGSFDKISGLWSQVFSTVGLILILLSVTLIQEGYAFPGWLALLPTFGTLLLIMAGKHGWVNRWILSQPLMVWIGLISYPLYLWHWPLLSFANIVEYFSPSVMIRCVLITFAVILSWITYRWIEMPLRYGSHRLQKVSALLMVMACLGILSYWQFQHIPRFISENPLNTVVTALNDWSYPRGLGINTINGHSVYTTNQKPPKYLFMGDSHLEQFGPRVVQYYQEHPNDPAAIFMTGGGCVPIPNVFEQEHPSCTTLISNFEAVLKASPTIDTIVIGASWNGYFIFNAQKSKPPANQYYYYFKEGSEKFYYLNGDGVERTIAKFSEFIRQYSRQYRVIVLLDSPDLQGFDPLYYLTLHNRVFKSRVEVSARIPLDENQLALNERLKHLAEEAGAEVIDQLPILCPEKQCINRTNEGEMIHKDANHFRPFFVIEQATYLDTIFTTPSLRTA